MHPGGDAAGVEDPPLTTPPPADVFALAPPTPTAPAATRTLPLLGAQVELVHRPERAPRRGRPDPERPSFRIDPVEAIVAEEALWTDDHHALTPNLFPFADRQLLLWSRTPRREPDAAMLALAMRMAAGVGAVLGNSIGAAASIARAHVHLVGERSGFLPAILTAPWEDPIAAAVAAAHADVEVTRLAPPFPALVVVVRGAIEPRAAAVAALLRDRTTPAFSVVDQDGTTWLMPRSTIETPAPWFPQALGSAELWGRWCYLDGAAFANATPADLAAALQAAGRTR